MGEKSKFKITEAVKIFVRLHGFIINITPFRRIMEMIEEKTQNKICIISIHHLANLNLIGKKICVFKDGEIVLQGIYQELSDELEKYGLNPEKN